MTNISPGDHHISETLRNTGAPPRHHRDTNETTPRRHRDISKALRSMTSTDIPETFASHQNKTETLPKHHRNTQVASRRRHGNIIEASPGHQHSDSSTRPNIGDATTKTPRRYPNIIATSPEASAKQGATTESPGAQHATSSHIPETSRRDRDDMPTSPKHYRDVIETPAKRL